MVPKTATSSGAFILREIDGQLKIALAQRQREIKIWILPKGHVESGETLEQAALREIHEETGLSHVQLLTYLGFIVRDIHEGDVATQKTIHYYLAYALPADRPELPTESGFGEVGWFSPIDLLELLPYEQEKTFMKEHLGGLLER